jgi:hypothetical protein
MNEEQTRMAARGRPKKPIAQKRVELKLPEDEMFARLEEEARLRNVSLQQHLHDIIRARWLAQQGIQIDLANEDTDVLTATDVRLAASTVRQAA